MYISLRRTKQKSVGARVYVLKAFETFGSVRGKRYFLRAPSLVRDSLFAIASRSPHVCVVFALCLLVLTNA